MSSALNVIDVFAECLRFYIRSAVRHPGPFGRAGQCGSPHSRVSLIGRVYFLMSRHVIIDSVVPVQKCCVRGCRLRIPACRTDKDRTDFTDAVFNFRVVHVTDWNIGHVIIHQAVLPKLCKRISVGMEIGIDSIGAPAVVVIFICEQEHADLLQICGTCNAASFLPGRIQSRKK